MIIIIIPIDSNLSPPLDIATYAALMAAWHWCFAASNHCLDTSDLRVIFFYYLSKGENTTLQCCIPENRKLH